MLINIKAFEGRPLWKEKMQILDDKGFYHSQFHNNMENAGCIALFGANADHFVQAKDGIRDGSGQAAGVKGYKYTMPIDTMSACDNSKHNIALATMRYMFLKAKTLDKLSIIVPMTTLTNKRIFNGKKVDDLKDRLQSQNAMTNAKNEKARNWANQLKYGDAIVNIGFGICTTPDLDLLYEVNNLVNDFNYNIGDIKSNTTKEQQMKYWNETVLENVKQIALGELNVGDDGELFPQQSQRKSTPPQPAPKQTQSDIDKFKTVLNNLRTKNQDFQDLSSQQILNIFTDAAKAEYYTNAPSGEPKLPLDGSGNSISDEQAKLMRRFSVEFQKECKNQGLTFSKTAKDNVNKNGMRTKSVVDFAKQNNIKLNDIFQAIWR